MECKENERERREDLQGESERGRRNAKHPDHESRRSLPMGLIYIDETMNERGIAVGEMNNHYHSCAKC